MKKAFTLIELLVVIAIIAILAAILFPVFSQAKLAAKKTQGLSQAKQVGTSMHIYLADYDDRMFLYRTTEPNPDYARCVASGRPDCNTVYGVNTRTRTFWNQILNPYVKNVEIYKSPGNPNAWTIEDKAGIDTEPAFRSYGGQNNMAVNQVIFEADNITAMSHTAIENSANAIVLVDASYYNTLPRYNGTLRNYIGAPGYTKSCTSASYQRYWKNMGNSYLFRWNGAANEPSDAEAEKLIAQRYSGQLVTIHADSHAKTFPWKLVVDDLINKPTDSMWDPWKAGMSVCP